MRFLRVANRKPACCKGLEYCKPSRRQNRSSPCGAAAARGRGHPANTHDPTKCRCATPERVTAVTPFYPNPWRKKCWGPFTAFRLERYDDNGSSNEEGNDRGGWGGSNGSRGAAELYRDAANWREALQSPRCQDGNQPARALLSIFHACALALVGTPTSTNGGVSCQSSAATTPWGN